MKGQEKVTSVQSARDPLHKFISIQSCGLAQRHTTRATQNKVLFLFQTSIKYLLKQQNSQRFLPREIGGHQLIRLIANIIQKPLSPIP